MTDSEEIGKQTDLKAYLSISGDDAYEAYINGQLVAKDENWFVAERVVANLYPGRNVLAIKGINGAGQSPGAVIADVSVGNGRFQSDETFLVSNTLSPQWTALEGLLTNATPSTSYGAIDSTVWWNRTYEGAYLWDDANFPADSAATWIWSDDVDNDSVVFFRKAFSLTDPLVSDSDGDGVLDGQDQLPLDPTEQLDIDRDGLGNNTDSDDDNDGIPDEAEESWGMDPLVDDASEDLDGDGMSNLREWRLGTNAQDPSSFNQFTEYDETSILEGHYQLGGDGLTVTSTSNQFDWIRSIDFVEGGKHYWEITINCGPDSAGFGFGIIDADASLAQGPLDENAKWIIGTDGTRKIHSGTSKVFDPEGFWIAKKGMSFRLLWI